MGREREEQVFVVKSAGSHSTRDYLPRSARAPGLTDMAVRRRSPAAAGRAPHASRISRPAQRSLPYLCARSLPSSICSSSSQQMHPAPAHPGGGVRLPGTRGSARPRGQGLGGRHMPASSPQPAATSPAPLEHHYRTGPQSTVHGAHGPLPGALFTTCIYTWIWGGTIYKRKRKDAMQGGRSVCDDAM